MAPDRGRRRRLQAAPRRPRRHPRTRRVDRTLNRSTSHQVDTLQFFHPKFPSDHDGFRILFVSDLHLRRRTKEVIELEELVSERRWDLVLFGGDYQDGQRKPTREMLATIRSVTSAARAKHGVFGCIGNHDRPETVECVRTSGVDVRENISHKIAQNLHLAVIGDAWDDHDDAAAATRNIPDGSFTLAVTHSPDAAPKASKAGVHLLLAGHTHGGQVILPVLGALVTRLKRDRRLLSGDFRLDQMLLHVSYGFGTSLFPIRHGTRSSVAEITLRHGPLRKNSARRLFAKN